MPADVRKSHLFSALSDQEMHTIMETSRLLTLDEGQLLFETGQQAQRFYFVLEGQIKLYRLSAEGAEKIIDIVQTGNTFAEALMFLEHPCFPVSATALEPTQLLSFDNQVFIRMLRSSVDTCLHIMGTMSQRLRGLIKEIDDLTLQNATTRMCGMLWAEMQHTGSRSIELRTPKWALAARLSIKPETFSRILNQLSTQGIIQVKGSHIDILKPNAITDLAHPEALIGLTD